jgi:hypothetical protein
VAKGASSTEEREVLIQKAEGVLNGLAGLFRENGAAEVFIAYKRIPARSFFYKPPKNFLGSVAGWRGAMEAVKRVRE